MAGLMRADKVSYIDFDDGDGFQYMSAGFTDLTDAKNPDVSSKIYINDRAESKTVRKYAPEWSFEFDRDSDDDVHIAIAAIGDGLLTGANAEAEYVEFLSTDVDAVTGLVDALKYSVVVQVDSTGSGAGGEELTCSGSLHGNGDPVPGTWDTADNTFTPDVS